MSASFAWWSFAGVGACCWIGANVLLGLLQLWRAWRSQEQTEEEAMVREMRLELEELGAEWFTEQANREGC